MGRDAFIACALFVISTFPNGWLFAQADLRHLQDAQLNFDNIFRTASFRFSAAEEYVEGPAWPNGTSILEVMGVCKTSAKGMWLEYTGSEKHPYFSRAYEDYREELGTDDIPDRIQLIQARVVAENSTVHVDSDGPRQLTVSGTVNSNKGRVRWNEVGNHVYSQELNFLFGYVEGFYRCHGSLAEFLKSHSCDVKTRELNGISTYYVEISTSSGDISIWYNKEPEIRLAKVELRVSADDEIWTDMPLGKTKGYFMGDKGSNLTRCIHRFDALQYDSIENHMVCTGFTSTRFESFENGAQATTRRKVVLNDISFDEPDIPSHSLNFESFSVPDKTRFWADDAPQIPFVVNEGRVAKVINESTLESMDGVRFAMPGGVNWFVVLGLGAVFSIFGLVVYRRFCQD